MNIFFAAKMTIFIDHIVYTEYVGNSTYIYMAGKSSPISLHGKESADFKALIAELHSQSCERK